MHIYIEQKKLTYTQEGGKGEGGRHAAFINSENPVSGRKKNDWNFAERKGRGKLLLCRCLSGRGRKKKREIVFDSIKN